MKDKTVQERFWAWAKIKILGHSTEIGQLSVEVSVDGLSDFEAAMDRIGNNAEILKGDLDELNKLIEESRRNMEELSDQYRSFRKSLDDE